MGLFIDKNNINNGIVYYYEKDSKIVIIDNTKKVNDYEVKVINFRYRPLSFKDQNHIQKKAISVNNSGQIVLDSGVLRREKMLSQLISWDIKDDNGKDVPVNADNIDSLDNTVATAISDKI